MLRLTALIYYRHCFPGDLHIFHECRTLRLGFPNNESIQFFRQTSTFGQVCKFGTATQHFRELPCVYAVVLTSFENDHHKLSEIHEKTVSILQSFGARLFCHFRVNISQDESLMKTYFPLNFSSMIFSFYSAL